MSLFYRRQQCDDCYIMTKNEQRSSTAFIVTEWHDCYMLLTRSKEGEGYTRIMQNGLVEEHCETFHWIVISRLAMPPSCAYSFSRVSLLCLFASCVNHRQRDTHFTLLFLLSFTSSIVSTSAALSMGNTSSCGACTSSCCQDCFGSKAFKDQPICKRWIHTLFL